MGYVSKINKCFEGINFDDIVKKTSNEFLQSLVTIMHRWLSYFPVGGEPEHEDHVGGFVYGVSKRISKILGSFENFIKSSDWKPDAKTINEFYNMVYKWEDCFHWVITYGSDVGDQKFCDALRMMQKFEEELKKRWQEMISGNRKNRNSANILSCAEVDYEAVRLRGMCEDMLGVVSEVERKDFIERCFDNKFYDSKKRGPGGSEYRDTYRKYLDGEELYDGGELTVAKLKAINKKIKGECNAIVANFADRETIIKLWQVMLEKKPFEITNLNLKNGVYIFIKGGLLSNVKKVYYFFKKVFVPFHAQIMANSTNSPEAVDRMNNLVNELKSFLQNTKKFKTMGMVRPCFRIMSDIKSIIKTYEFKLLESKVGIVIQDVRT